jgi:hypothetical protein
LIEAVLLHPPVAEYFDLAALGELRRQRGYYD